MPHLVHKMTIKGGEPTSLPPRTRLSLKVVVDLHGPPPKGLAKMLTRFLTESTDGRKMYSAELVDDGLRSLVQVAMQYCVEAEQRKVHGNKMVRTGRRSYTSKAVREAGKILKKRPVYLGTHDYECTAVRTNKEKDRW